MKNTNLNKEEVDFLNCFSSIDEFNKFCIMFSDAKSSLEKYYPGLIGAGTGALIGGGIGMLSGDEKETKNSKLKKLILGAILGGAVGGIGGHMFLNKDGSINQDAIDDLSETPSHKRGNALTITGGALGALAGQGRTSYVSKRDKKIIEEASKLEKSGPPAVQRAAVDPFKPRDPSVPNNDSAGGFKRVFKKGPQRDAWLTRIKRYGGRQVAGAALGGFTGFLGDWVLSD